MCRFLAYNGPATTMEQLLFETDNSLVEQSRHAKMRYEPTNGDGFGIGWYVQDQTHENRDVEPATFVSIEPAWSNRNLRQLASKIYTRQFFAHVRDASTGMPVSQSNCHPYQYGPYLWMHNGHLEQFSLTRRSLLNGLSDQAFDFIKGNTDTEHAFALFLDQISFNVTASLKQIEVAILKTLKKIIELRKQSGVETNAQMNFAVSNGSNMIFTRFSSHSGHQPPSLYYLIQETKKTIIVASEPLNETDHWKKVERNHMLIINQDGEIKIKAIDSEAL